MRVWFFEFKFLTSSLLLSTPIYTCLFVYFACLLYLFSYLFTISYHSFEVKACRKGAHVISACEFPHFLIHASSIYMGSQHVITMSWANLIAHWAHEAHRKPDEPSEPRAHKAHVAHREPCEPCEPTGIWPLFIWRAFLLIFVFSSSSVNLIILPYLLIRNDFYTSYYHHLEALVPALPWGRNREALS